MGQLKKKVYTLFGFKVTSIFCSRILSPISCYISSSLLLRLFLAITVSQTFLILMTLTVLRSTDQIFCRTSLTCDLSDVFLMIGIVVFSTFFNFSLNLAIRSSWSEPQSTPQSCFRWLYRASPSLATKNIINLILMSNTWWCPCVGSSLVLLEEGVCYDQCILLAKLY